MAGSGGRLRACGLSCASGLTWFTRTTRLRCTTRYSRGLSRTLRWWLRSTATQDRIGSAFEWSLVSAVGVVSHAAFLNLRVPCAREKLSVVHNGIAPVAYSRTKREAARGDFAVSGRFVGVIVARLSGLKGHATLLRSLNRLRAEGIDLTLLIAGDGAQRSELEREARDSSLDDRIVRFLGARSSWSTFYAPPTSLYCRPIQKGFRYLCLKPWRMVFRSWLRTSRGIPELIDDGKEGLLIPPADPVALAAAIRRLRRSGAG